MTEKVKLTFEKSDRGDRVIIQKDGGFTTDDVARVTEVVEDLFHSPDLEEGEPDVAESGDEEVGSGGEEEEPFNTRVKREARKAAADAKGPTTPPGGRGKVQEKLPDGTGITKDGDVDRRTLRGSPESPDPKQQREVRAAIKSGKASPPSP